MFSARLREVEGIGPERAKRIKEAWAAQKSVRDIMIFLQGHGIGSAHAAKIFKEYGESAIEVVRENPYRLAKDISGIGFRTATGLPRRWASKRIPSIGSKREWSIPWSARRMRVTLVAA